MSGAVDRAYCPEKPIACRLRERIVVVCRFVVSAARVWEPVWSVEQLWLPQYPAAGSEQLSISVDRNFSGGLFPDLVSGFLVGAFDEFAVLELGARTDEGDQVWGVDRAPA